MSVRDDLNTLCRIEAEMSALKFQQDELRSRLRQHALEVLDRDGAAPTWRADLGTISLTVPKPKAVVADEDAFAKFIADAYGDGAVEAVLRVKQNVREAVLGSASENNLVDGVTIQIRPAYLTVRLSKDAKAAAAADVEEGTAA